MATDKNNLQGKKGDKTKGRQTKYQTIDNATEAQHTHQSINQSINHN